MELLHGERLYERFRARARCRGSASSTIARAVCSSLARRTRSASCTAISSRRTSTSSAAATTSDFVKVLDFGIAKIIDGSGLDASDLTHAGQMIGTFDYMAPEQMVGGGAPARATSTRSAS